MRNVVYRLRLLRTWSSVGGLVWGGTALSEKVCHLEPHPTSISGPFSGLHLRWVLQLLVLAA